MRIAYVSSFYPNGMDASRVLRSFPLLTHLPIAVRRRGHRVRVLGRAATPLRAHRDGVGFEITRPGVLSRATSHVLHRWKPRYGDSYYQLPWELALRIRALKPDIVHAFGLTMDLHLAVISRAAQSVGAPLVVHYHGGVPADSRLLRAIQHGNLRRTDALLVTAVEQARPWSDAGLVRERLRIFEVVESSSPFTGLDRRRARAETGMTGDPVCLSAGRLHPIKDPLTTLRGFERIARARPSARLYLYYLSNDMPDEVSAFVASRPLLPGRVEFRGRAEPHEMEAVYSSADYLLQASRREWSGLAVLEAMSCGCIPVVSDIPSFRALTDDGKWGLLFPLGDDRALADLVLEQSSAARSRMGRDVQTFFQSELSFDAMAGKLEAVYQSLLDRD
ncbi:MAG: glycosyltransferase family 4 protein [Chloroflexota bacterium]